MIIRMGGYYYCMQDVSNWRYINIVEGWSKYKSQLWFIKKNALSEVKHYFTIMIRVIEYSTEWRVYQTDITCILTQSRANTNLSYDSL